LFGRVQAISSVGRLVEAPDQLLDSVFPACCIRRFRVETDPHDKFIGHPDGDVK
jgi:hypothetical protein